MNGQCVVIHFMAFLLALPMRWIMNDDEKNVERRIWLTRLHSVKWMSPVQWEASTRWWVVTTKRSSSNKFVNLTKWNLHCDLATCFSLMQTKSCENKFVKNARTKCCANCQFAACPSSVSQLLNWISYSSPNCRPSFHKPINHSTFLWFH